jgi:hypothetical protein
MNVEDQRTIQSAAVGKGMTFAELRTYVERLTESGCPDGAHPNVKVTIAGRINVLSTKFDVAPGQVPAQRQDSL